MWKNVRIAKFMTTIFFMMTLVTATFYALSRLILLYIHPNEENNFSNDSVSRPMFVVSKFFFNTQKSPVFEIIWICQFLSILISACAYISFDGFFIFSVLHLCGQLANLKFYLKNVSIDNKYRSVTPFLKIFIKRHIHLHR